MQKHLTSIAVATVVAGSGCTVISQYNDVQATQQRVNEKEIELANEEALHADLQNEMKKLSVDLASKRMSNAELDHRLAVLQERNDQLAATNAQEKQKTAQARAQLAQYRAQLAALQRDKSLSDQQAAAQIAKLKEEISKRLAILAAAQ